MTSRPYAVLGDGPVAMIAALRARQLGRSVELFPVAIRDRPLRVECVPTQLLALLVEFGVIPRRIGVARIERERVIQWGGRRYVTDIASTSVHICRPDLELELARIAAQARVLVHPPSLAGMVDMISDVGHGYAAIIDATGRSAVTAVERYAPRQPVIARWFSASCAAGTDERFMLAACPDGYAYRLGNGAAQTVGIVGRGSFIAGSSTQVVDRIATFARWMVRDLEAVEFIEIGAAAAGVQISYHSSSHAIGDATFSRDILSSQGLATGIGSAIKAMNTLCAGALELDFTRHSASAHASRVLNQIQTSPFGSSPDWIRYIAFLHTLVPERLRSNASQS